MRVVLLGPPGAGKGTQAERLAEYFGVAHLSTGDMLRAAIAEGSELGRKAEGYVNAGELVPSELLADVVAERLYEEGEFLLDGYPRNVEQATFLEALDGLTLDGVLYIDVDDETLVRRLTGRRICPEDGTIYHIENDPSPNGTDCGVCGAGLIQREDDREETVRRRLGVYKEETEPLIGFYKSRGLLVEIDGEETVDEVFARAAEVLKGYDRGFADDHC
jgi:adenylate kinase